MMDNMTNVLEWQIAQIQRRFKRSVVNQIYTYPRKTSPNQSLRVSTNSSDQQFSTVTVYKLKEQNQLKKKQKPFGQEFIDIILEYRNSSRSIVRSIKNYRNHSVRLKDISNDEFQQNTEYLKNQHTVMLDQSQSNKKLEKYASIRDKLESIPQNNLSTQNISKHSQKENQLVSRFKNGHKFHKKYNKEIKSQSKSKPYEQMLQLLKKAIAKKEKFKKEKQNTEECQTTRSKKFKVMQKKKESKNIIEKTVSKNKGKIKAYLFEK